MDGETNGSKEKKGTTVFLEQEAYDIIKEKQIEIYTKIKKTISIQELVSNSIKKGTTLISAEEYA